MRLAGFSIALVAACLLLFSPAVYADDAEEKADSGDASGVELYMGIDFCGKYVWRGIVFTDSACVQPTLGLQCAGLKVEAWGNHELTDVNGWSGRFSEIDYNVHYLWNGGNWNYSVGMYNYTSPTGYWPTTTEYYFSMSPGGSLCPTLTVYRDTIEVRGEYMTFGISHCIQGKGGTCLELGALVAYATKDWAGYNYGVERSGFTDALFTLKMPISIDKRWTITPGVSFSTLMMDDYQIQQRKENFWYTLGISSSF